MIEAYFIYTIARNENFISKWHGVVFTEHVRLST